LKLNEVILNDSVDVNGLLNVFASVLNDNKLIEDKGNELELPTLLLIGTYPDRPEVVLLASQVFEACGKYERSVSALKDYCQKHPENYPMWERLLFAYSSRSMTDELYTSAKYVATKFNLSPVPKLLLAFAANERGEYDLAISELDKAYTLAGNNRELIIEITSLLAGVYYKQGDTEKAFITFDKGLELSPDNAPMLNNYAYYLAEEGIRLKEARNMIEACLKIESNSTYLDTYAWILYKLGKYRKANQIMGGLLKGRAMESADHYEHYGFIRRALGDCEMAKDLWKKAMEMDTTRNYLEKEIKKCQSE
jgi:tetratricopeptide (TPR) repeat protein